MTTRVIEIANQVAHAPHRFTVDNYYRMVEVGVLTRDDRVELLDGQVVEMSPSGSRHAGIVDRINDAFSPLQGKVQIRVQNPVRLDRFNEPEPDVTLLKRKPDGYMDRHPGPSDVYLIIEVCDSSERTDRQLKLPLYARFEIPEVWLIVIDKKHLEIHRGPLEGRYTKMEVLKPPADASPAAFPDIRIDLSFLN